MHIDWNGWVGRRAARALWSFTFPDIHLQKEQRDRLAARSLIFPDIHLLKEHRKITFDKVQFCLIVWLYSKHTRQGEWAQFIIRHQLNFLRAISPAPPRNWWRAAGPSNPLSMGIFLKCNDFFLARFFLLVYKCISHKWLTLIGKYKQKDRDHAILLHYSRSSLDTEGPFDCVLWSARELLEMVVNLNCTLCMH